MQLFRVFLRPVGRCTLIIARKSVVHIMTTMEMSFFLFCVECLRLLMLSYACYFGDVYADRHGSHLARPPFLVPCSPLLS